MNTVNLATKYNIKEIKYFTSTKLISEMFKKHHHTNNIKKHILNIILSAFIKKNKIIQLIIKL